MLDKIFETIVVSKLIHCQRLHWNVFVNDAGNPIALFDRVVKQLVRHFRTGVDENVCLMFLMLTSSVEGKAGRNVKIYNIGRIVCGWVRKHSKSA